MKTSPPANEINIPIPQNAIFMLNDDCLLEIMRYLDIWDVVNMLKADLRFRSAVELQVPTELDFSVHDFVAESKNCQVPELVEVLAKKVTFCLIMDGHMDPRFVIEKLPLFENLKHICIHRNLSVEEILALPKNLYSLDVGRHCQPQSENLAITEWLRHQTPSLKDLKVDCRNICIESLKEFYNLETLEITFPDHDSVQKDAAEFIEQNQKLQDLDICMCNANDLRFLSRLTQLRYLTLQEVYVGFWDNLIQIVPESLRELTLKYPMLQRRRDCKRKAVKEITIKLQKIIPGLIVAICNPEADKKNYNSDSDDSYYISSDSDFYYD